MCLPIIHQVFVDSVTSKSSRMSYMSYIYIYQHNIYIYAYLHIFIHIYNYLFVVSVCMSVSWCVMVSESIHMCHIQMTSNETISDD